MAAPDCNRMTQYIALIDGEAGAYGVSFPDVPGCVSMGETLDEAYANAVEALHEWLADCLLDGRTLPEVRSLGAIAADSDIGLGPSTTLVVVPLVLDSSRSIGAA